MTSLRSAFAVVALCVSAVFASGCSGNSHAAVGGETNWLRHCDSTKDCGSTGSCICGLCSERCAKDDDCSAGLTCRSADSALVSDACGANAKSGLCAPDGKDASVATPDTLDASVETPQGRTPHAYVLSALLPDSSCVYADGNASLASGALDIATSGDGSGDACAHGYHLRLKVASDEPGALQLSGATVKLMDLDQKALNFASDLKLPNPFTYVSSTTLLPAAGETTATGIYEVEAVRAAYAPFLAAIAEANGQILVEVRLQALDANDAPVTFRPFVFPITICSGCLTMCNSELKAQGLIRQDVVMDHCDDNSGTDDRICFDPGC